MNYGKHLNREKLIIYRWQISADTRLAHWTGDTRPRHSAAGWFVELQTKVRDDFTITEKAPTRGFT